VPRGISLCPIGTMASRVGTPTLRNFAWLPFWETRVKPCRSNTLAMYLDEYSLGTSERQLMHLRVLDVGHIAARAIFKEEL
jgi:hypothetical protein